MGYLFHYAMNSPEGPLMLANVMCITPWISNIPKCDDRPFDLGAVGVRMSLVRSVQVVVLGLMAGH